MRPQRPFYLNLLRIHLPIGGWVSILHRASGALLSLLVPFLLYALMLSLRSQEDYAGVVGFMSGGLGLAITLVIVWAGLHHLLAGLRHLGFDMGWGEERQRARQTAWATLIVAVGFTILLAGGTL